MARNTASSTHHHPTRQIGLASNLRCLFPTTASMRTSVPGQRVATLTVQRSSSTLCGALPTRARDPDNRSHDHLHRTWSNGSEALHRKAYLAYEASTLPVGAKSQADQTIRLKLFRSARCPRVSPRLTFANREHDELRHSFRSVLQHFRPHVHKVHLVTGDLPAPTTTDEESRPLETANEEGTFCELPPRPSMIPRLGQVPAWLNTSRVDGDVQIDVTHHSQYFTQYEDTVFNSLAIESQFPNLPNLHDHL